MHSVHEASQSGKVNHDHNAELIIWAIKMGSLLEKAFIQREYEKKNSPWELPLKGNDDQRGVNDGQLIRDGRECQSLRKQGPLNIRAENVKQMILL